MPSLPRLRGRDSRYENNMNFSRNEESVGISYHPIPRRANRPTSPYREERYEQQQPTNAYEPSSRNINNLQVKVEDLREENMQIRSKLTMKDRQMDDMTSELKDLKNKCVIQNRLIQTLQEEADILKKQKDTVKEQEDHQAVENEMRIRKYLVEKEEAKGKAMSYKEKLYSMLVQIGDALSVEVGDGSAEEATEKLVVKITEIGKDHEFAIKKIERMEDTLNAQDVHTKASRETIMRLVSEIGKEQKSVTEVNEKARSLEEELNEICIKKENIGQENENLRTRMRDGDKLLANCQEEVDHYREKAKTYQDDMEKMEVERNMCRRSFEIFRNTVAKVLGCEDCEATLDEGMIHDRIQHLISTDNVKKHEISGLEAEILDLKNKVKYQEDLYQNAVYDLKQVERDSTQTESRLKELEDDLVSGDVLRDTLRNDRSKYLSFLEEMADAMKVGEALAEMGHSFDTDVLIARANQLVKLEGQALVEKSSSNLVLRKQVKQLKEKLKNKELHLGLVQKKTSDLQEKDKMRTALAIDRDDAIMSVQKLHHKVERLQNALGDQRLRNTELKAELADTNELKVLTLEQKNKIDELMDTVGKLAEKKEHQRQRIGDFKYKLKVTADDADKTSGQYKLQLDAVTGDLKSTKTALDEVSVREKQLLDFRVVVARMLSLDVTTLSIPDFEIISRLEALIRNHHVTAAAHASIQAPLEALDPRFVKGFREAAVHSAPLHRYRRSQGGRTVSPRRPQSPNAKRY